MSVAAHAMPDSPLTWRAICEMAEQGRFAGFHVETDGRGHLLLTPVNTVHGALQGLLTRLLGEHLPEGVVAVEIAITTQAGIKVPDVVWMSRDRFEQRRDTFDSPIAPEICVEVLSPSNDVREMADKQALYFEQGAQEVWLCDAAGQLTFWWAGHDMPQPGSQHCAAFPTRVQV